ncbi:hypothetical protein [Planktothrix pseudagardhii]|uniref:Uncharacterized protein n=1 Tax=Planktothrix pseudagardhii TaxID=132604 RepID=A0A9W4G2W1_9CYAN|nr:hypothetical protein [Planktothrix pseudagardhii]CAD5928707.1 hypothetical protein NO713_01145 [Planktothrix pseudagardhii]
MLSIWDILAGNFGSLKNPFAVGANVTDICIQTKQRKSAVICFENLNFNIEGAHHE